MKTFKEISEPTNTLMVVDALNLAFRWKHSGALDFKEDYLRTVQSLAKSYKAKHVIIAADWGSSTYRKNIYPEYKQNRKDKFAEQSEAEALAFQMFFEEFEETLKFIADEYPVLRFKGVEADDICAYICEKVTDKSIWLISSDKDYDLLVRPGVSRFSYVTRKEVTVDNWHEHYEFDPEDYISIKCLTGDAGDNVMGVPGIGPKRAVSLVKEHGTTWDIIANLPLSGKYKYIQELNKCGDLLQLNYQLMDLQTFCKDAIGQENIEAIDELLEIL
jgi:5'-3' exonuclease